MELEDGSIVINVRNQNNYHCRCRMIVRSLDGGETLPVEELVFDKTLIDPAVAAGALQKQGVMYFTNPCSAQHSEEEQLKELLLGGGAIWPKPYITTWHVLYHDDNIYHHIGIFFSFTKVFIILKSLIPHNFHNPCHQCQTNTSLKRETQPRWR